MADPAGAPDVIDEPLAVLPSDHGFYCTGCRHVFQLRTLDGLCPRCEAEPLFDLSTADGRRSALQIEEAAEVERQRRFVRPFAVAGMAVGVAGYLAQLAWLWVGLMHGSYVVRTIYPLLYLPWTVVVAMGAAFSAADRLHRRRHGRRLRHASVMYLLRRLGELIEPRRGASGPDQRTW